jgi:hypothetical protein
MIDRKATEQVWGFEGCGAMWTFYTNRDAALKSSGENPIYDFTLEEAFELDRIRRTELGFNEITFQQFLDCIDVSASCVPANQEC